MRKETLLLSACAALLVGCAKDIPSPLHGDDRVALSVQARLDGEMTKASPITAVPDFAMYGYTYASGSSVGTLNYCIGEKMTKDGTSFSSKALYPAVPSGINLLLVGVAPYGEGGWSGPADDATGTPVLTYRMPSSVADQKDVVVSTYSTSTGFDGTCDMTFSHILSGVRFALAEGGSFGGKVVSVALRNIHSAGTYTVGTGWSGQKTPATTSQTINKSVTASSAGAITSDEQTFIVLPQSLPADAEIEIVANDGVTDRTLTASLSGRTFETGKIYTYSLNLSSLQGDNLIIESVDLTSWEYDASQYGASKVMDYTATIPAGEFRFPEMVIEEGTRLIIDWGDGSPLERCSASGRMLFGHNYASAASRTVSIYAIEGSMTFFTGYARGSGPYTVYNETVCRAYFFNDLSKYDFLTGTAVGSSSQETANCYVVGETGAYGFPLVYGNGIRGGAANPDAYSERQTFTNGGAFVDHAGNRITSPYILTQTGIDEGACRAEVLWTTKSGMISDVSVRDGYVSFTVNSLGGNASIALKQGDTTVLWSWHIWATDYGLSAEQGMLNHDLGDYAGYSCYYEWGRKDPFPESMSVSTAGQTTIADMAPTVRNPETVYQDYEVTILWTQCYNFCTKEYRNNWDADSDTRASDSKVVKTIYDPCPPGFTIPRYNYFKECKYDRNSRAFTLLGQTLAGGKYWDPLKESWTNTGVRWTSGRYYASDTGLYCGTCALFSSSSVTYNSYKPAGGLGLVRPVRAE